MQFKGSGPHRVIRDGAGRNRLSVNVRSSPTATEFSVAQQTDAMCHNRATSTCGHANAERSTALALTLLKKSLKS